MKELSLNILDIVQNSLTAGAKNIEIDLAETADTLRITVTDDGCGMSAETVKNVTDPFYTTRKTRGVGLGIPFFKLAAEQTGGKLELKSVSQNDDAVNHGTVISALFYKTSIDFTPLGDIISTLCTLVQGLNEKTDIVFTHSLPGGTVSLSTAEMREVLCGVPLSTPEVLVFMKEDLNAQYEEAK
ncbi:MAG: sensor histidine kinase [Clostridia bacterium]|nr:sensor histidine kinase [Clostridia bacterium]